MLSSKSFRNVCQSSGWFEPELKILVACSGGIDSTVLLHLIRSLPNIHISMVHFDHQLRGSESDTDRQFVQQLGTDLGFEVHILTEDIQAFAKLNGLSIEEAGSIRRRAAFQELKDDLGYNFVASGQHLDDQIETILMNLYLGSGIQGLTGTGEWNQSYIRPLLQFTRLEINDYAEKQKLHYRTDKSNTDISFLRNNIRANLIPLLRDDNDYPMRSTIQGILRQGQALNRLVETSLEDADIKELRVDYAPKIGLGLGKLAEYFSPIQKAIFDRAFQSISLLPQGISSKHFTALKSLFSDKAIGKEIQLPASVTASRARSGITLFKRSDYIWTRTSLSSLNQFIFPFFQIENSNTLLEDHIQDPAYFWYMDDLDAYTIRAAESGDRMIIDDSGKSISIYQLMQSARVAPHLKEFFPVVEHQGEIIWIPGIRTAPDAMIPAELIKENRSKHCMKAQFQKGTFE